VGTKHVEHVSPLTGTQAEDLQYPFGSLVKSVGEQLIDDGEPLLKGRTRNVVRAVPTHPVRLRNFHGFVCNPPNLDRATETSLMTAPWRSEVFRP
jgi:hypothetical protein